MRPEVKLIVPFCGSGECLDPEAYPEEDACAYSLAHRMKKEKRYALKVLKGEVDPPFKGSILISDREE